MISFSKYLLNMYVPSTIPDSTNSQNEQKNIPFIREFLLCGLLGVLTTVLVAIYIYSHVPHNNLIW